MANDENILAVAAWLESCLTRFKNMQDHSLDLEGYPRLQHAMDHYRDKGYFTVGHVQYLFNRTHALGKYKNYNTHKSYHTKYGHMLPCPLKDLVDSNLVNWRTGSNGVIQTSFQTAIKKETTFEWRNGNLRPQQHTTFADLFGEP
jgi:hypothetical protein